MTPIGLAIALVALVLAGARSFAERVDEVAHAPAEEADRVFRLDGEICTPRTCEHDHISMCCVYITHTLHPRHAYAKKPVTTAGTLTRNDVAAGIRAVSGRFAACRDKYPARGQVSIRVVVDPAGAVENVITDPSSGDAPFDECIISAARRARFARSEEGVRFRYPIAR